MNGNLIQFKGELNEELVKDLKDLILAKQDFPQEVILDLTELEGIGIMGIQTILTKLLISICVCVCVSWVGSSGIHHESDGGSCGGTCGSMCVFMYNTGTCSSVQCVRIYVRAKRRRIKLYVYRPSGVSFSLFLFWLYLVLCMGICKI